MLKKLIQYLLYFLIFLLPWQTRWIYAPGEWEYTSRSLYGSEILLGLIFVLSIIYLIKNFRFQISDFRFISYIFLYWKRILKILLVSLFLCFFVLLSATLAENMSLAFYYLSKIIGGAVLIILIRFFADFTKSSYAFIAGMTLQAGLGIWQFLSQSSFASTPLRNLFLTGSKWFGIALNDAATLGTSVVETVDGRWLRAYGALPHPNILAGYLVVGILLIMILYASRLEIRFPLGNRISGLLLLSSFLILATALFFTFSRAAWIALIISLIFYLFINLKNRIIFKKILKLSFVCLLVPVVFSFIYLPLSGARISNTNRLEIKSTTERMKSFSESLHIIKNYPFLGAGPGNYTLSSHNLIDPNRESFSYQPVHNIYLLIISEIGILGFLCLSVFLFLSFSINLLLLPILILGLFDHYLLSLYSGIILTSLCLGLSLLKSTNSG